MTGQFQPVRTISAKQECEPSEYLIESLQRLLSDQSCGIDEITMQANANSFAMKADLNELRNGLLANHILGQFKAAFSSGGERYTDVLAFQLKSSS